MRLFKRFFALVVVAMLACALSAPAASADPVVAASGDIACGSNSTGGSCQQGATANVLATISGLNAVLPLGDDQYECGELSNFTNFYNPTWGRFKSITRPAVGNHEYRVSDPTNECLPQGAGAPGYYTYFGSALASPLDPGCTSSCRGFYSYDLGTWHLIALNSNCSQKTSSGTTIGCSAGSLQYNWLKGDLANARTNCILAYWHQPRYSSGGRQSSGVQGLWEALYDAGADVVLTGHDHVYERFGKLGRGTSAAVDPVADANGIREWVVGTGGRNFTSWSTIRQQSQVRDRSAFGVLQLTLHSNSYDWKFLPQAGKTFTDSGTTTCNGAPVSTDSPPSVPTGLAATAISPNEIDLSWNASTDTDATGVAGYHVFRNGTQIATVTSGTSFKDTGLTPNTAYSYTVSAFDTAAKESAQSSPASATTPPTPTDSPPSVPTGLAAAAISPNEIDLSWNASTDTDGTGVAGYHVFRDGTQIATVTSGTSFKDTGLTPNTAYSYTVSAFDTAANESAQSSAASATTPAGGGGGGAPLFSDDFESGDFSKWSGVTALTIQSSVVNSGTHAARATATGSPAFAFKTLATPASELFYRLHFNIQSKGATSMYLARLRSAPNTAMIGPYVGSTGILCYRNDVVSVNSCSTVQPTQNVWHTLLVHVIVNGTASTVEMWLDGTKLISKTDNLGTAAAVSRIELGDSASGKTFDVALDDVVVDTNALSP